MKNKKFKKMVRDRMAFTGESYMAAARVIRLQTPAAEDTETKPSQPEPDHADAWRDEDSK